MTPNLLTLNNVIDRLLNDIRPNRNTTCLNFKNNICAILSHSSTRLVLAFGTVFISFIFLMIKFVNVSERLENEADEIAAICQNESSSMLTQMCTSINTNTTQWEEMVAYCCDTNVDCASNLNTGVTTYCDTQTDFNEIEKIMKIFLVGVLILACLFITINKSVHIAFPERYTPIPDLGRLQSICQRIWNITIPAGLDLNHPIVLQLDQVKRVARNPEVSFDDIFNALTVLKRTLDQSQQRTLIRYPGLGNIQTEALQYGPSTYANSL